MIRFPVNLILSIDLLEFAKKRVWKTEIDRCLDVSNSYSIHFALNFWVRILPFRTFDRHHKRTHKIWFLIELRAIKSLLKLDALKSNEWNNSNSESLKWNVMMSFFVYFFWWIFDVYIFQLIDRTSVSPSGHSSVVYFDRMLKCFGWFYSTVYYFHLLN